MNGLHIICILTILRPLRFLAEATCNVSMPSTSMKYLDNVLLQRYRLLDPCTVTCNTGYTGDFCQDETSLFTSLPVGPWNQAGYYTSGSGLLRTQSISVNSIDYIQYTKQDSMLIGILDAVYASSRVVEIALYSRTIKPVLTPPSGGSFDSLVVRSGVVYLARTRQISLSPTNSKDIYDAVVLSSTYAIQPLVNTSARIGLLEVFIDKGTVTVFVYLPTTREVQACYPDYTCPTWATLNDANSLACGADCPLAVYASAGSSIFRVSSTGAVLLRNTGSAIYCLTGMSALNILLYKSTTTIIQHSLTTQTSTSIPLGVADTGLKKACSLDITELNNQILIAQDGVIRTLESVQVICGYGLTSQSLLANSSTACMPCPAPPSNAFWIEGSAVCEWNCKSEFTRKGSNCVAQVMTPCPAYHVPDTLNSGLCVPSRLPWVGQGRYVHTVKFSSQLTLQGSIPPYPTATVSASVLIEASAGLFYVSRDSGVTWASISLASFTHSTCPVNEANRFYYLSSRGDGILWVGYFFNSPVQHCLWAVNAMDVASARGTQLQVLQAWSLRGRLCAATGDVTSVYLILCDTHYLSYSRLTRDSSIIPLAGSVRQGYLDSSLQTSLFKKPSSIVMFDSRLYVADTGNCVIRELDLYRDTVKTVVGTAGMCQRGDDGEQLGATVSPTNLIYTPYQGFFLFTDKYAEEAFAAIRQFHVPTCTVQTIRIMPTSYFNEIMAVEDSILVRIEKNLQILSANGSLCPAGTSSLTGSALSMSNCISCGTGFYSDVISGACRNCSTPTCALPGQLLVPCQTDRDAFCGACTNKPTGNTQYIGPSSVTGAAVGGGDCPWTYTPPCPIGYYASSGLCSSCPEWSTTASAGSTSLSQCFCLGNGYWKEGICIVPAVFGTTTLQNFPLLQSCPDYAVDSPSAVCPCEPGEYIQQINPKICTPCQDGSYSPTGTQCLPCPDRTESSLDKTTCRCVSSLRDASEVTDTTPKCVCGPGKSFSAASLQCAACEANTFSTAVIGPESGIALSGCMLCEGGTFSGSSASACTQCPFGTFRVASSPLGCQNCPAGKYATNARSASCTDCADTCGGLKETVCPTDPTRLICSPCVQSEVRANALLNGERNCATSCQKGYFERDGDCIRCTAYDGQTCASGRLHVPCSPYLDAACVPCVNASMPLNYAVWRYVSATTAGPNTACEWECEAGYSARRLPVNDLESVWECVLAGAWSVWDLFTI